MTDHIQITTENQIASVKINRPSKKNAITLDMYSKLTQAFQQAESDPNTRVLFITGTEGTFTAGNDLGDFLNNPPSGPASPVFQFLDVLAHLKKPLIAAATGAAVGLGTTLLLHCDLVYLGESAKLKLPFVNLGLCPEAASSYLLPAIIGYPRASEAILLGDTIYAQKAVDWGMANEVYTDQDYQQQAYEKAKQLAKQPAASVRLSKQLLKQSHQMTIDKLLGVEAKHFADRLTSPEAKEAFTAFFEKRPADFTSFE